jgi:phage gp36-like protein
VPTPITVYAQVSDLDSAINPAALANVGLSQKQLALKNASAEMDDFFRDQFTLPFVAISTSITQKCVDIAVYRLMKGQGYNPSAGADDSIRQGFEDAVCWLRLVATGKVVPGVTDSAANAAPGRPSAQPSVISSSQRGLSNRGDVTPGWPFQGS